MTYVAHALHTGERIWPEANCYVDLWIELLHSRGLDPLPLMTFALAADFEGDQWTFFKPPLADLGRLYGVEVEELNVWRGLVEHLEVQASRGRTVIVEVDSFFLPDTAGTTYQTEHGKTALAVVAIDGTRQTLAYFHGAGMHRLEGADFRGALRLDAPGLAPYVELVKWRGAPLAGASRGDAAWALLREHVARIPRDNPIAALGAHFASDVQRLGGEPPGQFHAYAFAILRQLGAASELAARSLRWLVAETSAPAGVDTTKLTEATAALESIAGGAKTLQFKLARAVHGKKSLDGSALTPLAESWSRAKDSLGAALG